MLKSEKGQLTAKSNVLLNILAAIAASIPVIFYCSFIYRYALNIPHMDDYDAILGFLVNFKNADFADKLALLFSQHNEHRILSSRIAYVLYYTVTGTMNFKHIIILNTGMLAGIFLILAYFMKKAIPDAWKIAAILLSYCLFDINNYDNAVFAMYGMQNYGIFLLFLSSILFYSFQKRVYLIPAILLQVLCIFSSGNGNVAALFIVVYACLSGNKAGIIASVTAFVVFAPLYYFHYQQPATDFFTTDTGKIVTFFLHATGAHFGFDAGIAAGVMIIAGLAGAFVLGTKLKKVRRALPLWCLVGFMLSSLAVMSVFRGNLPVQASHTSRYFIYSNLLVALSFAFVLLCINDRKIMMATAAVMTLLVLFVYRINYGEGEGGFQYYYNSLRTIQYDFPRLDEARAIAEAACKEGIYCIEEHRADE